MKKKQDFETTEQPDVTLNDYVIPEKVEAFCKQYKPAQKWSEGCDVFADYQLRAYFKAVVTPLGDPLVVYLQMLSTHGFIMQNDVCGEPVIYAMPHNHF